MSSETLRPGWETKDKRSWRRLVRLFPCFAEVELYVNSLGGWAIYLNTNEQDPYSAGTLCNSMDVYPMFPAKCKSPAAAMAAADSAWAALVEQWHNNEQQRRAEGGEA